MSLDQKVQQKMDNDRSLTERIALYVPIYRGYKQKNLRRDEDRAVRQEVARVLETVKNDLATVQRASVNDLALMRDAERIRAKADKDYIGVKKSVGGYSRFHDPVKITESDLQNLVRWDAMLIENAVLLKSQTEALIQAADSGSGDMKTMLRELEKRVDVLAEEHTARDAVMKGFKE